MIHTLYLFIWYQLIFFSFLLKESDDNELFDTNIVFYENYNENSDKNINNLKEEISNTSSSETEFFDSIDSLHDTLGDNTFNKKVHDSTVLTACLDNQVNCIEDKFPLTKRESLPCFDVKLPQDEKEEKIIEQKLKVKDVRDSNVKKDLVAEESSELTSTKVADLLVENIGSIKDHDNSVKSNEEYNNKKENVFEPPEKPKRSDKFEDAIEHLNLFSTACKENINTKYTDSYKSPRLDGRGGKYNKRTAPPPPPKSDQSAPIKATLVLQPGVVQNCLPDVNTDCKNIFFHAPKARCRNLVKRSHSSLSSTSASPSRTKQSLSKLMKFPKMIGFWNRDEPGERKSPSQNYLKTLMSDSKLQSKSDNNLSVTDENINISMHGTNLPKSGSLVSISSLTESPLAHRRLRIIRRYVDDDID